MVVGVAAALEPGLQPGQAGGSTHPCSGCLHVEDRRGRKGRKCGVGERPGLCTEPGWKDLLLVRPGVCVDGFVRVALGLASQGWALPQAGGLQRFHTGSARNRCFLLERGGSRVRLPAWSVAWDSEAGDQAWRSGAGSPFRGKAARTEEPVEAVKSRRGGQGPGGSGAGPSCSPGSGGLSPSYHQSRKAAGKRKGPAAATSDPRALMGGRAAGAAPLGGSGGSRPPPSPGWGWLSAVQQRGAACLCPPPQAACPTSTRS